MIAPQLVHGMRPQGWVEVDAARLVLVLARSARAPDAGTFPPCLPGDRYMGHLSASDIKTRQYRHKRYRQAQISELIPDLTVEEIMQNFQDVFGEPLEVPLGQKTHRLGDDATRAALERR